MFQANLPQTCPRTNSARISRGTFCLVSCTRSLENSPRLMKEIIRPGIREHFLFSPTRYATNRFMENFRNLLRFAWPHDTQDTYRLDSHSELYSFTPLYLHHQSQIECWQMDPEFFNLFPEFRGDIPTSVPSLSNPFTKHLDFGLTDLATGEEQSNERSDNALSLAVTT